MVVGASATRDEAPCRFLFSFLSGETGDEGIHKVS